MIVSLSGCQTVKQGLQAVGSSYSREALDTPNNNGGEIDWSFVPIVREMATEMFTKATDATILETAVVSKNGASDHVIVIITYDKNGVQGNYGFDYKKNAEGQYELTRYGEGVRSDDI